MRSGRIVAWDHIIASCSRNVYRKDPRGPYSTETYGSYVGRVQSLEQLDADLQPTRIPNARLRYGNPLTGVATGAWRAPAHVVNAFTIETTIDELAARAKRSPVDLRLEILGETADVPKSQDDPSPYDPARMRRVLLEVVERGGFGKPAPEGRARGLAMPSHVRLLLRARRRDIDRAGQQRPEARHDSQGRVGGRRRPAGQPVDARSADAGRHHRRDRRGVLRRGPDRETAEPRRATSAITA